MLNRTSENKREIEKARVDGRSTVCLYSTNGKSVSLANTEGSAISRRAALCEPANILSQVDFPFLRTGQKSGREAVAEGEQPEHEEAARGHDDAEAVTVEPVAREEEPHRHRRG